jgi:hypothetical protein
MLGGAGPGFPTIHIASKVRQRRETNVTNRMAGERRSRGLIPILEFKLELRVEEC